MNQEQQRSTLNKPIFGLDIGVHLNHLHGRQSLMGDGDANTYAVYRDVVVEALARWLASDDPKALLEREWLKQELERLRDDNSLPHLRVAAWNVFVEAAQLREQQEQRREEDLT